MAVILAAFGMATTAQAFTFMAKWPASPLGTDIYGDANPTIAKGIKYIYEWGVGLGGIAVFIVLVKAGFQYITSVGDPTKMKDAFQQIQDAVIGLLILLSSYAILNLVGLNLNSMKMGDFNNLEFDSPILTCTSAEGAPDGAPECCKNKDGSAIPECNGRFYDCVEGICQLKITFTPCTRGVVKFDDGTKLPLSEFDVQEPLDGKTIESMALYYGAAETDRCYDPSDTNANKSDNPACACGLQLFTKTSTTSTGGIFTNPCENNTGQAFANNNESLKYYTKGQRVVCVMLTQQATSTY